MVDELAFQLFLADYRKREAAAGLCDAEISDEIDVHNIDRDSKIGRKRSCIRKGWRKEIECEPK